MVKFLQMALREKKKIQIFTLACKVFNDLGAVYLSDVFYFFLLLIHCAANQLCAFPPNSLLPQGVHMFSVTALTLSNILLRLASENPA